MTSIAQLAKALPNGIKGKRAPTYTLVEADSFLADFLIQTHISYTDSSYYTLRESHVVPTMLELGIRAFRERMTTNATVLALVADLYATHGIRQLVVIPTGGDAESDFATLKANYSPAQVLAIEGYNEPDNVSPDATLIANAEAAAAHIAALSALVKADPDWKDVPIIAPSFIRELGYTSAGDLTGVTDFRNLHPYPVGNYPEYGSGGNYVAPKEDGPFWVTENGYQTLASALANINEAAFNIYINRLIIHWKVNSGYDVRKFSLYELLGTDTSATIGTTEQFYGLLWSDGTKQQHYYALKNFLTAMDDAGAPMTLPKDQIVYTRSATDSVQLVVCARRDGSYILALWNEKSVYNTATDTFISVADVDETIEFALPIAGAQILDTIEGVSTGTPAAWTDVIVDNDTVTVPVGPQVKLLRIVPRAKADLLFMAYDDFKRTPAPLDGSSPLVGPPWVATGEAAPTMTAGDGVLTQTDPVKPGYATMTLAATPRKIVGRWVQPDGDFAKPATLALGVNPNFQPMAHFESGTLNSYITLVDPIPEGETSPVFNPPFISIGTADVAGVLGTEYWSEVHWNGDKMAAMVKRTADGTIVNQRVIYDIHLPEYVGPNPFWQLFNPYIEYHMVSAQAVSDFPWPDFEADIVTLAIPTTSEFVATPFGGSCSNAVDGLDITGASYGQGAQYDLGALVTGDRVAYFFDADLMTSSQMVVTILQNGVQALPKSNIIAFTADGRVTGELTLEADLAGGSICVVIGSSGTAGGCRIRNFQTIINPPTSL